MKFKLDANLGTRGCWFLATAGHDVSTAGLQGLACAADQTLIEVCGVEGRTLVTLDTDFAKCDSIPRHFAREAHALCHAPLPYGNTRCLAVRAQCALGAHTEKPLKGR